MTYNLKTSPSHLLHRAQQIAANESASALAAAGITLRQFSVLAALSGNDGVSQSDLVNATGIDRSTLADMVARMEKAGLIKRVASKTDKRAKVVSLMAKGKKAYEKALPAVEKADAAIFEALPKTKQATLVSGLKDMVAEADKAEAAVAPKPAAPAPAAKAAPKPAVKKAPAKKPAAKKAPAKKPAAKKAPAAKAAPKPAVKKAPAKKAAPKAKAKAAPKAKPATTTKAVKKAPVKKARKATKK
ncbi:MULTISPECIES: MarR family winged helix-turn-helix transcriptional regulator [unclassified Hyphomonas]|jgi:DNA-binding MarR family transcriptional regulator|uniref:Transcriptional regulator, MarR family n=1 Tax=hydrothermal vent metagenome TaxID=652676 RepID=A0A170PU27_9ZZZZ|nr:MULTISPECIES: MarR family transcriptional regulator [unclassified Hyphomonas]MAN90547.1 MarR family transcriptional regulator [Hyphomonadaceae bacterium]MAA81510.1 MarR family transcriptional regulator [Hyphomonas sp.]MAL43875.1 MarR family transcriptional regulator [Hyphomonas sp.]MAX84266.1 MarR family transcriptional regulator [Hyphomonas sp.]MBG67574.1 MarR family transcriptional regulator [Hyphomonas sp.]|tara:strand:+ start:137 stop:868 length:732 start_codon:yes stop_codon:yes gene_type:complete|mmetsp:Transcript_5805/g.14853  ORF Transcript_5805/g.14853 Transcript_5805/m.14853 type:complete len:244 (-) Transcript_5805:17-748(-)|eukprot:CAMPEP_0174925428 /NCGR_PEP_ID=MMETSP1355-20121228/7906_1 /TAXON_ID=464990 /ORGANISM="Hemiselmis tepida, Strain CCMP443" /LENGTH=243 /DNA_ID=CAMNT_0016171343 /DNA_START=202 /DNA_END=933 /DNA_ORIENTATION=-